ncbi:MAG: DEAD/DEAH box helicase [Clostridia bacterium]|nr:DEAD/DEAH box helicase [Clostridia bacterium]
MKNIEVNNKLNRDDARVCLERFLKIDADLNKIISHSFIENIVKKSKAYVNLEVENILKGIDIDEINNGDFTVRTSLLKKAGYTNYLKIYKLQDVYRLTKIKGISSSSAYQIRKMVYEDAKRLKETTFPYFDIDNKTPHSNELLKSIYEFKNSQEIISLAKELNNKYHLEITTLTENANILKQKLKWFFASKQTKNQALNAYSRLQQIENENYLIDATFLIEQFLTIQSAKLKTIWEDFKNNSAEYYAILEKLSGLNFNNITNKNGLSKSLVESINALEPDFSGLKCTLRGYQEFGTKYILHQGYVLLGDEMGLGKTVQAIASMVAIRNFGENRFLVVCPASVLINWCREIVHHSDLQVYKLHGNNRDSELQAWITFGGVAVTTYETLDKLDLTNVFNISLLVADEAHYVKNPSANRTINLNKACDKAERVLFMTGTALENTVDEMSYLISILNVQVADEIKDLKHLTEANIFREKVSLVYLRRTREDVLQELPDLIETEEWCEMGEAERQAYFNSVMSENFMAMRQVSWDISDISKSSKANRLKEIYEEAKNDKRKVIVFSYFLNTINKVKQMLGDVCFGPINGSVLPQDRQKIIDEFTKAEDGSVLLAQIQAGGTGVNIQAASCVILCEPQLKPSTENQAISRTYRMGQTRNVQVFRLLCENSVDERITEILVNKEKIFENFADVSVVGKKSIEIDAKTSKNIVLSEVERLKKDNNH